MTTETLTAFTPDQLDTTRPVFNTGNRVRFDFADTNFDWVRVYGTVVGMFCHVAEIDDDTYSEQSPEWMYLVHIDAEFRGHLGCTKIHKFAYQLTLVTDDEHDSTRSAD